MGALEIKLTIADPGYILRQNRIARVDISELGLKGDFYVVGVRTFASAGQGIYQEVRLREKNYAISKRVPTDPKVEETPSDAVQTGAGGIAELLGVRWKEHFVEAANKHHGPWPFSLFLGVLLLSASRKQDSEINVLVEALNGLAQPMANHRVRSHKLLRSRNSLRPLQTILAMAV